jgi:sec-independent protein translocase protein TatA
MFGGIGHWELLLVAFVAFLLFGQRLPGLMKSMGSSLRSFREGMEGPGEAAHSHELNQSHQPANNT